MEEQVKTSISINREISGERQPTYPYHLIGARYSTDKMGYLVYADYSRASTIKMTLCPFSSEEKKWYKPTDMYLDEIMQGRRVSALAVVNIQQETTTKLTLSCLIGFSTGQLLFLQYHMGKVKELERFNKSVRKQGKWDRLKSYVSGQETGYKVFFENRIRKLQLTANRFKMSYLSGSTVIVFLVNLLGSQEDDLLAHYSNIKWELATTQPQKLTKLDISFLKAHSVRAAMGKNVTVLEFKDQISDFQYSSNEELFIVDNQLEKIIVFDVGSMLKIREIVFDFPIRSLEICTAQTSEILIVIPYDTFILVLDEKKKAYGKLSGTKSYITSALITGEKEQHLLVGALDHRVCTVLWNKVQMTGKIGEKPVTSDIKGQLYPDIYSLGAFNSARSNQHEYGFGDFFHLIHQYYCFFTYDSKIKVIRIPL